MPSERVQRRIDRLLDEAEQLLDSKRWQEARDLARQILLLDDANTDALSFLATADGMSGTTGGTSPVPIVEGHRASNDEAAGRLFKSAPERKSFASGRYAVKRFLGEGGKKKVYLAHDTLLDRDVAFALIKTEGLDDTGRDRIRREAQAMGRLGSHPHIVSVFDLGEEPDLTPRPPSLGGKGERPLSDGQPYIVTELMGGGDVESLIEKAAEHRPPLERSLEVGIQVCRGLEFAHSHGIVHRDLKPGNVWLTADGVAKLGDFGLAVALDRSRLTQAGMMVGTVSYMPPEQAMGGEVTPQSDLYSLGAMLYELVTGRPPFVGDESVAIITQHLNVVPIAPSWHNPSIPPAFEVLILRLLEKDPSRRPASASEVRAALESIAARDLTPRPPSPRGKGERSLSLAGEGEGEGEGQAPDGARGPGENPLYRRVFVGREAEIRQLQSAFDSALSGRGALAMVVGEPGIGKTAVCEQLATYVTLRGGTTLTGHCYEEGSLSLPYLAFVEALRSYAISRPPEALRQELGTAASDLARIVSEVRERLSVEPRPPGDPEEDRWRLLQAVSGFLRNASTVQPLLLVLEDLHWADQGTLDLLLHLARNLQGARLLVIGTYRDVEVDRSHPLSATLAELRRGAEFGRVLLRGLGTPEVQRMLLAITGAEVPGSLAEAIHRQTEGNPLFVQEVVRYLVEEGHLGQRGPNPRPLPLGGRGDDLAGLSAFAIPEGLRDVIGRRLSRLSPNCNRVLAVAAVIGRDFGLETLHAVVELDEEQVVSSLEEALHIGVLEEQSRPGSIRYRFAHAFFRQTLYEELIAPRRLRLHQQVAAALEQQYGNRLQEHAAELAEHFAQSTDRDDLAKAVRYGELGAQRALAVYAYGEAARHLEQALAVQEVLDPDDTAKRCDLLLALGEALGPTGEPARVFESVAPLALSLAQSRGDETRASKACHLALTSLHRFGAMAMGSTPEWQRWTALADQYAAPESLDRARADLELALTALSTQRLHEAWERTQKAVRLAELHKDADVLFWAGSLLVGFSYPPAYERERQRIALDLLDRSVEGVSARTRGWFLANSGPAFLDSGQRQQANKVWDQLGELATHSADTWVQLRSDACGFYRLILDGWLEEAANKATAIVAQADRLGLSPLAGAGYVSVPRARVLMLLGRAQEAVDLFLPGARDLSSFAGTVRRQAMGALCLAAVDRVPEASDILTRLTSGQLAGEGINDVSVCDLAVLLDAAVVLRHSDAAAVAASAFEGSDKSLATCDLAFVCLPRLLGGAAPLLGEHEKARDYYEQALEVCTKVRFRPELALSRLELAELLLVNYPDERADAIDHLDFAIGEFREMKMQPSLERALRHKDVLKA